MKYDNISLSLLRVGVCVFLMSCGVDNTNPINTESNTSNTVIALKLASELASSIGSADVTVSGEGMSLVQQSLEISGNTATGILKVPIGQDRLFVVYAYDREGNLAYTGQALGDVLEDERLTLELSLEPIDRFLPPEIFQRPPLLNPDDILDPISPPFTIEGAGPKVLDFLIALEKDKTYIFTVRKDKLSYIIVLLTQVDDNYQRVYGKQIWNLWGGESNPPLAWDTFVAPETGNYKLDISNIYAPWIITVLDAP